MLATFILGVLAGAGAPYAEPKIKEFLDGFLLSDAPIQPGEMKLFSLAVCLVGNFPHQRYRYIQPVVKALTPHT